MAPAVGQPLETVGDQKVSCRHANVGIALCFATVSKLPATSPKGHSQSSALPRARHSANLQAALTLGLGRRLPPPWAAPAAARCTAGCAPLPRSRSPLPPSDAPPTASAPTAAACTIEPAQRASSTPVSSTHGKGRECRSRHNKYLSCWVQQPFIQRGYRHSQPLDASSGKVQIFTPS